MGTEVENKGTFWIETFTGNKFYYDSIDSNELYIEDIAHALANTIRFGGHAKHAYTVAEHSVHISNLVDPDFALWGLMHDATEAYMMDMPSPLKRFIPKYKELEDRLSNHIFDWFVSPTIKNLNPEKFLDMFHRVKDADIKMLITERNQLFDNHSLWGLDDLFEPYDFKLNLWSHKQAEQEFLNRFKELTYK